MGKNQLEKDRKDSAAFDTIVPRSNSGFYDASNGKADYLLPGDMSVLTYACVNMHHYEAKLHSVD